MRVRVSINWLFFKISAMIQLSTQQTTPVFSCYVCTTNNEISQTNINYQNDQYTFTQSIDGCGNPFSRTDAGIFQVSCNTSCMVSNLKTLR